MLQIKIKEIKKEWHKPEGIKPEGINKAHKHFHIKFLRRLSSLLANNRILKGEIIKFAKLPRANKHKN